MTMTIDDALPGGNIIVQFQSGREAVLAPDLRDTSTKWFYWKFRVRFSEPGRYVFRFAPWSAMGARGPAVSADQGRTWEWLGTDAVDFATESFAYDCPAAGQERWFCVCIPYLQTDWERFTASIPTGAATMAELCRSRQNRSVECLSIGNPDATRRIFLSSRHHAQESMATFTLEGFLREVMDNPDDFADFFIFAVPFMDKDGVENGDQGKNRRPHDHARDYGPDSIYPEVKAVIDQVNQRRFDLILDLHCPWLRGGPTNETVYFVGTFPPEAQQGLEEFSRLLAEEAPPDAPHFPADNLLYGTGWNTANNYTQGMPLAFWANNCCDWKPQGISVEIPFANLRELTFRPANAINLGRAFARAARRFLRQQRPQ